MQPRRLLGLMAGLGLLMAGKIFLTQQQALELAFGAEARVVSLTHWLTEAQSLRAAELAGSASVASIVQSHAATDAAGKLLGTAYFDTRTVRSHPQCLMVVVGPDGRALRVAVLSFDNPSNTCQNPNGMRNSPGGL